MIMDHYQEKEALRVYVSFFLSSFGRLREIPRRWVGMPKKSLPTDVVRVNVQLDRTLRDRLKRESIFLDITIGELLDRIVRHEVSAWEKTKRLSDEVIPVNRKKD